MNKLNKSFFKKMVPAKNNKLLCLLLYLYFFISTIFIKSYISTELSPANIFFIFSTVSKPALSCASLVEAPI